MKQINKFLAFSFFISFLFLINSCDEINDTSYTKPGAQDTSKWQLVGNDQPWIKNTGIVSKVMVTDYTGMKCVNCPRAARIIENIKEQKNGNLITLSVNSGIYAIPDAKHPLDLRSKEGNEIDNRFGASTKGNPIADFNRTIINENDKSVLYQAPSIWGTLIDKAFLYSPSCGISIQPSYDIATRIISFKAGIYTLKDLDSNQRFTAYIVEDSIIGSQLDLEHDPEEIPDYAHNGVLWASFTGTFGSPIIVDGLTNSVPKNVKIMKSFSYQIPENKTWNINHIRIIAFIADKSNEYRISQVEQEFVIKK